MNIYVYRYGLHDIYSISRRKETEFHVITDWHNAFLSSV